MSLEQVRAEMPEITPEPQERIRGLPELLFLAHRRKEIGDDEFVFGNACWAADHAHEYLPKRYLSMSPMVMDYVEGRRLEKIPYDKDIGEKLGEWLSVNERIRIENESDARLLEWSMGILRDRAVENGISKIQNVLLEHRRNLFPMKEASEGRAVQIKDSRDSRKERFSR